MCLTNTWSYRKPLINVSLLCGTHDVICFNSENPSPLNFILKKGCYLLGWKEQAPMYQRCLLISRSVFN